VDGDGTRPPQVSPKAAGSIQDARWWQSLWQSGRCHAAGCDITDLLADWGVAQGEHVLGVRTPHEYLASLTRFVTADASGQVGADVLLLAGVEDHYVPFRQFGDQLNTLTGARSVTARVFTREKQAQSGRQHRPCPCGSCPIGSTSGTCGAGF
jgi:hypothetical protein